MRTTWNVKREVEWGWVEVAFDWWLTRLRQTQEVFSFERMKGLRVHAEAWAYRTTLETREAASIQKVDQRTKVVNCHCCCQRFLRFLCFFGSATQSAGIERQIAWDSRRPTNVRKKVPISFLEALEMAIREN